MMLFFSFFFFSSAQSSSDKKGVLGIQIYYTFSSFYIYSQLGYSEIISFCVCVYNVYHSIWKKVPQTIDKNKRGVQFDNFDIYFFLFLLLSNNS